MKATKTVSNNENETTTNTSSTATITHRKDISIDVSTANKALTP